MVLDVVSNFLINKVLRKQEAIGPQLHTTIQGIHTCYIRLEEGLYLASYFKLNLYSAVFLARLWY